MIEKWWRNWKTRTLGFVLVLLGSVQSYSGQLQDLMDKRHYGIFTVIIGVMVAGLGFLNSQPKDPE